MKYFGIKDQSDKLICVATKETLENVKIEVKQIFGTDDWKICEVSVEELDAFIEEWADGAGVGTKLLCRTLVNKLQGTK